MYSICYSINFVICSYICHVTAARMTYCSSYSLSPTGYYVIVCTCLRSLTHTHLIPKYLYDTNEANYDTIHISLKLRRLVGCFFLVEVVDATTGAASPSVLVGSRLSTPYELRRALSSMLDSD